MSALDKLIERHRGEGTLEAVAGLAELRAILDRAQKVLEMVNRGNGWRIESAVWLDDYAAWLEKLPPTE